MGRIPLELGVSDEEIAEEYNSGMSTVKLSNKYNCSLGVITRRLEKVGCPLHNEKDSNTPININNRQLVRIAKASEITGLSPGTLRRMWDNGEFEGKRVHTNRFFYTDSLYKYIDVELPKPPKELDSEMVESVKETTLQMDDKVHALIQSNQSLETAVMTQINENARINLHELVRQSRDNFTMVENNIKQLERRIDKVNLLLIEILENMKVEIPKPHYHTPEAKKDAYAKFGGR